MRTTQNLRKKGILKIAKDHGRDRGIVGSSRDYGRKGDTVARIEDHSGEMESWEKTMRKMRSSIMVTQGIMERREFWELQGI